MVREGDVVSDMLRLLQTECGDISQDVLSRVEHRVRHEWGGQRVYILRDPYLEERKAAALQDWRNGTPIAVASDAHGIDRTTLYRLINRRRSL